MLTDFPNSFATGLSKKFAARLFLYFPSHLKRVATLPCDQNSKNLTLI